MANLLNSGRTGSADSFKDLKKHREEIMMNMKINKEEMLKEWELSKEKPTKRFKEILGVIAKYWFDKCTEGHDIEFEYWVKDYIIQGGLKNRHKYNPEKGVSIYSYFWSMLSSYAINISQKLIKGELKSSEF